MHVTYTESDYKLERGTNSSQEKYSTLNNINLIHEFNENSPLYHSTKEMIRHFSQGSIKQNPKQYTIATESTIKGVLNEHDILKIPKPVFKSHDRVS